ncbi:MAG: HAMP domain-containing protein [Planctomycetes bacterium]|nr:HAMP domain-containing protein [Planctomycetota bacterium]
MWLIFSIQLIVLLAGGSVVWANLASIRHDTLRLAEEAREHHRLHMMAQTAAQMEVAFRMAPAGGEMWAQLDDGLRRLRSEVQVLRDGGEKDPSEHAHKLKEEHLLERLGHDLEQLATAVQARDLIAGQKRLESLTLATSHLLDETEGEFHESSRDIRNRGERSHGMLLAVAVGACLILLLFFWFLRQRLVRPLLELASAAQRFGQGELRHRVETSSPDEIGDVARAFNEMAAKLARDQASLEHEVRDRTEELVRARRLADVGVVAASIAHEINNPLASIASCAEALQRRMDENALDADEQRAYLAIIAKEAYRARDITRGLVSAARDERSQVELVRVLDVVRDVVMLEQHVLVERGIEIGLTLDDQADSLCVMACAAELKQLLLNLVQNARDAIQRGPGRIDVRLCRRKDQLALVVEDDGPGVDAAAAQRVFDLFFTTKPHGGGFGLATSKRIVERYGGQITVDAAPTGGACFTVTLPLALEEARS